MKNKIILSILLIIPLITACITEFKADLPDSGVSLLVVEGNIIENQQVNFYLSRTFSLNEIAPPEGYNFVTADLILVGSDGSKSDPAAYLGNGIHRLSIGQLQEDVSYGIEIKYDGETYRSDLMTPMRSPEIDSVSWSQPVKLEDVSIRISTHDEGTQARYFLWDYEEDWEFRSQYMGTIFYDYENEKFYEDLTAPYYYCWKYHKGKEILVGSTESLKENRIVNSKLYSHVPQNDRFDYLYSVRVTQQALSKAGYEYYLDKIKANEGMGGIFTPQPSETEGNIECITDPSKKALGFVDVAKNITEKRIFISSGQISKPSRTKVCVVSEEEIAELKELGFTSKDIYGTGYRPIGYIMDGDLNIETWVVGTCADCVMAGGSKNKPVFWPNDHK